MKTIHMPTGKAHVRYDEIAHLIADALWPAAGPDDARMAYGLARVMLDSELAVAMREGRLNLRNPLTLGPHTAPRGHALKSALLPVADLRELAADRDIAVVFVGRGEEASAIPKPMPKQLTYSLAILQSLREQGLDPRALPPAPAYFGERDRSFRPS